MCLITNNSKPLIAKKNIAVYKILDKDMYSIFYGYEYKLNQLNKTHINIEKAGHLFKINSGFHAYHNKIDVIDHFFKHHLNHSYYMICKAVIPKGSEYYIGDDRDIVSNQLIIKRRLLFNMF